MKKIFALLLILTFLLPPVMASADRTRGVFLSGLRTDFDGVDEAAKGINDPTFNTDTAGTICTWVNPDTVLGANGVRVIFSMGGEDTDQATNFGGMFIGLRYLTTGSHFNVIEFQHRIDNSATLNRVFGDDVLSAGSDYHICVSSSGTAWKMYVNGVLQTLTTIAGSNTGDWFDDIGTVGTRIAAVGNFYRDGAWGAAYWDGKIDNSSTVWSSQLTDAQILTLYAGGKPIHPSALVGTNLTTFLKMGEDENSVITTLFDAIGDNNFAPVNMEDADIVISSYY